MPAGDGTGPAGMGPMTGRAAGYCAGYGVPGYMNPVRGRFLGRGFGRGRGWRNWYKATGMPGWMRAMQGLPAWGQPGAMPYQSPVGTPYGYAQAGPSKETQLAALRTQAEQMQSALENIQQRIQELEQEDAGREQAEQT